MTLSIQMHILEFIIYNSHYNLNDFLFFHSNAYFINYISRLIIQVFDNSNAYFINYLSH